MWSRGRAQLRPWDLQFIEDQGEGVQSPSGPVDEEKELKSHANGPVVTGSSSTLSVLEHAKTGETSSKARTASGTSTMADRPQVTSSSSSSPGGSSASPPNGTFPFEVPKDVTDVTAKPRMFGPERPLLDPRIRRVHALIVRDMLLLGVAWTAVWVAVVCCVPSGRKN